MQNLSIYRIRRIAFNPRHLLRMFAFIVCTILAAVSTAGAGEWKVLKFGHGFPSTHYIWIHGGQVFTDKVEEASGGAIKVKVYPAGQLGKDYFALLRSGLVDLSILVPSYEPEKLPLSSIAELPGMPGTVCEKSRRLWRITRPGSVLDEVEYKPLGLRVLFVTQTPNYAVMTTSRPISSLESLAGRKIRASGAAMDKAVRALGAVSVHVSSPEIYDALWRGTVDGAIYPYSGLPAYGLEKLLKYSVSGPWLGSGVVVFAISRKTWHRLSEEEKNIVTKAAASTQESLCKWQEKENARVRHEIVAQHGHRITELAPEQAARWNERLSDVPRQWAKEMDALGKPGSRVLRAYLDAAREINPELETEVSVNEIPD